MTSRHTSHVPEVVLPAPRTADNRNYARPDRDREMVRCYEAGNDAVAKHTCRHCCDLHLVAAAAQLPFSRPFV